MNADLGDYADGFGFGWGGGGWVLDACGACELLWFGLASGAPGGGAGGDGVAGEVGFTAGTGAAFFPAVLEEPVFRGCFGDVAAGGEAVDGGGFIAVGDVLEGTEGDEAGFFAKEGGVDLGAGEGGVEFHAPADFVGHPVADARAGGLIEEEGFEGFFWVLGDELAGSGG